MARELTVADQAHYAESHAGMSMRLTSRERFVVPITAATWIASEVGICVVHPPHHVAILASLLPFVVMVLASRVRFETPLGFTVASQLAFVPLMFALPPTLLAPAVALALVVSAAPEVLAGRLHPVRLVNVLRNSWFAMGPAWVLAATRHHDLSILDELLLALAAQFLVDFVVSCLCCWAAREANLRDQLRESWVYLVDIALSGVGLLVAMQIRTDPWTVLTIVPLLGVLAMFAQERSGRLDKLLELNETYRGTALLLGDVVEADDEYTGRHSQGVVELALAVGDRLGMDPGRRRDLEFAALLHDIGKIAIPKAILNKPGTLDAAECALMKTHAAEGERMLARVGGFMTAVGTIVRSHHERWDGGGYPDGLIGEAAPLEARIITCADSWSAMRTDRPYRRALPYETAVAELRRNVGTQFDPRVAAALLSVVADAAPEPDLPTPAPPPPAPPPGPLVAAPARQAAASASA